MPKTTMRAGMAILVCVAAMTVAPSAWADMALLDPEGLTWWDQIIAWLTGDATDAGPTIDPYG